jgi:predicted dehydrogenase
MSAERVGVGIVGLSAGGGWAATAHLPALRSLDGFELRGVAASSPRSAAAAGEQHGVPLRFDSAAELAAHDAIDLVVVAVKVPHHLELVRTAIAAGKTVYCEWPLGRNLAEAEEMAALAAAGRVCTAVGLQARAAPAFHYLQDLIRDGYVGEVLSTSVIASGVNWGATYRPGGDYMLDRANGATMLTVPFGHTVDLLTMVLGEFSHTTATLGRLRTEASNRETGEVAWRAHDPDRAAGPGLVRASPGARGASTRDRLQPGARLRTAAPRPQRRHAAHARLCACGPPSPPAGADTELGGPG